MKSALELIDEEMRRLSRELRESQEDPIRVQSLPARWSYHGTTLCWHVVLAHEVLEPDLDIELTSTALIVRGQPLRGPLRVIGALLPVPRFFDIDHPTIRLEAGYLEITVPRRRRREQ